MADEKSVKICKAYYNFAPISVDKKIDFVMSVDFKKYTVKKRIEMLVDFQKVVGDEISRLRNKVKEREEVAS